MRKLCILFAAIGLIAAFYLGMRHRSPVRAETAPEAPRLTAVDLGGNTIDTSAYHGKVVLINFWAAWCTPCAAEIPQFVALQDKYSGQGFQTIGVSMDDKQAALRDFYRKYKMNYPVIPGTQNTAEQYGGVLGLPTTFLIGRDGRIHARHSGLANFPELEREVVTLLQARR